MVSTAPNNPADIGPADVEVDEPTQPYSRAEIDRLKRVAKVAKSASQEQPPDAEPPKVAHVVTRGLLTVASDEEDENGIDPNKEEWVELDGRLLHVCLGPFQHFGFSGAPPGMVGAVDASFVSGTIGGDGCVSLHPGPQILEVDQAEVDQAAPEPETEDFQPFSPSHKRKLWLLVAALLALALTAWGFTRPRGAPVQSTARDAEQERADASGHPNEAEPTVPTDLPANSSSELDEIASLEDGPPSKAKERKSVECKEHRKSATDAENGGNWARLLDVAQRHRKCWPRVGAKALQMEALFQLGDYGGCVRLAGRDGSKKEIRKWLNACKSNL